ncbi:MAG: prepilin-type N-terminal cleavage/methylation domain-containing protein, partial [Synergistaceae bacterium]|nr:prepilin-type N-terminal cleavage/methylation domain-containing protein [Synergistaceae bacterium]
MKKFKAFTLIEILIALLLSGILSLTLINALRYISLSSQKAARILLARERGERVIAFIEQRILHCAFGLSACKSKTLFQQALGKGTGKYLSVIAQGSQWPIIIYKDGLSFVPVSETNGVYKGAAFAVIYAQDA